MRIRARRLGRWAAAGTAVPVLWVLVAAAAALAAAPVAAAQLSLPDTAAAAGTTLRLGIRGVGLTDVGAVTLRIGYDRTVLSFTGLHSQVPGIDFVHSASDGTVSAAWADLTGVTPLELAGGGLLELEFEVIGPVGASTELTFGAGCELADSRGWPLAAVEYGGGRATVVPPAYGVGGRVTLAGRLLLAGTTVAFSRRSGSGKIPAPVATTAMGYWSASGFEPGTVYAATPRRPGWEFSPPGREFAAAAPRLDFHGEVPTRAPSAPETGGAATYLLPNTPNPFNAATVIAFVLARGGAARVELFDAAGRSVRVLVDGWLPAGCHAVRWDGTAGGGEAAGSGVYVVLLAADGTAASRLLVLVR